MRLRSRSTSRCSDVVSKLSGLPSRRRSKCRSAAISSALRSSAVTAMSFRASATSPDRLDAAPVSWQPPERPFRYRFSTRIGTEVGRSANTSSCRSKYLSGAESGLLIISYWPGSNVHCAPFPAFFMISFGSIVQSNFEMLSTMEPAAPSDDAPAVSPVALTSFASRPVKVRLRTPKVRSQVRVVISTLLVLQTINLL